MAPNKISVAQAACGWKHTAALAPNGSLFCWGWGGSAGDSGSMDGQASSGGQLGLGNEFDSWNPRGGWRATHLCLLRVLYL